MNIPTISDIFIAIIIMFLGYVATHPRQASITVPREEVISISATPAVHVSTSDADTADEQGTRPASAVSLETSTAAVEPLASHASDASKSQQQVMRQPPLYATGEGAAVASTGRWLTVPTYGRFGRQRGYQRVWQAYGTQQYYAPSCAGGRCR